MTRQFTFAGLAGCALLVATFALPAMAQEVAGTQDVKQMAGVEQWMQKIDTQYSKLAARLERIIELANEQGQTDMANRAQTLLDKAHGRYQQLTALAETHMGTLQSALDKVSGAANLGVGDKLPGNRQTIDNTAPANAWQGAGETLGKAAEGSGQPINLQVDPGMVKQQVEGQLQGVSRENYQSEQVGNNPELEKALKESDSMP